MVKSLKRTIKESKLDEFNFDQREKIVKAVINNVLDLIHENIETIKQDKSLEWNTGYTYALCDIAKIITEEYYDAQ